MAICPEACTKLHADFSAILADNLVGIYIHGSIAFGCFNPERSDLDVITVVRGAISTADKLRLLDGIRDAEKDAPEKGIEISFVLLDDCLHFRYPTPYQLHYSPMWRGISITNPMVMCSDELKTDKDLAAHFSVIRYCGIAFCGKPITQVFGPVPAANYLDSLLYDVGDSEQNVCDQPVSIVLNLCRVLAYLQTGKILSKKQGGIEALEQVESDFHPVIRRALVDYEGHSRLSETHFEQNVPFCRYMLKRIERLIEKR